MNQQNPSSGDSALAQGQQAAQELASALATAGFVFPSLRGGYPVMERGRVELGGISASEVFRLAAWIRERTEMRRGRPR
ncbi:hypothetical protein [Streptomyces sp. WZ-12]|uniref:hypothetical protein n=1 Tax=Streptomyces sp. WZ-12 TaxID=3030210 RepID=UPI002380DDCD|nr:hypothetical protein [Streptomyces sp. WZ-12]